jgi:hypothetical protein
MAWDETTLHEIAGASLPPDETARSGNDPYLCESNLSPKTVKNHLHKEDIALMRFFDSVNGAVAVQNSGCVPG